LRESERAGMSQFGGGAVGRGRERIPSRLPAELGAGWGSLISGA